MRVFKYKTNRSTRYWTGFHLIIIAVLSLLTLHLYDGGYISAWFVSCVVAAIALMVLSVPRKIVVTDKRLLVRCVLDITEIQRSDIASVRIVEQSEMQWILPLFGSIGFFGYYGHFLDLKNLNHVEIYASEWSNFIEITTIYEDIYYISCSEREELVESLSRPECRD